MRLPNERLFLHANDNDDPSWPARTVVSVEDGALPTVPTMKKVTMSCGHGFFQLATESAQAGDTIRCPLCAGVTP